MHVFLLGMLLECVHMRQLRDFLKGFSIPVGRYSSQRADYSCQRLDNPDHFILHLMFFM